jgi:ribonuclease D
MSEPHPHYVDTPAGLAPLLESVRESEAVGLDTEFVSEGVYEPLLCLIQVATVDGIWIVDPLTRLELGPFWQSLTAPGREVVVVAAREEVRFCLRYAGRAPDRLLDLQIAAGLVGYGYPLSHTNLVRRIEGVTIHGGEGFTDWRKRPLTQKQLDYAADDVRYLGPMRDTVLAKARKLKREAWVEAECERYRARIIEGEEEERWRIPGSASLSRRDLAVLRELWRWRDQTARRDNLPVRRVLRDDLLIEIAKRKPPTTADLFALRGLEHSPLRRSGGEVVVAVQKGLHVPDADLPTKLRRDDPHQVHVVSQLLSVLANSVARENEVDAGLLSTASDIQEVVRWRMGLVPKEPEPVLFQGWRGELLRAPLLETLDGRRHVRVGDLRSETPLVFAEH